MAAAQRTFDPSSPPGSRVIVRPPLAAGMAFMNAAREGALGYRQVVSWMEQFLVEPGLLSMPASVQEEGIGTIVVEEAPNGPWATAREVRAARIVSTARVRVAVQLTGLISRPVDDRFLAGAIFSGRVQRVWGEHGASWRPTLVADERLSDVVLSLFVADILANREDYESQLCVCDVCGRVSFSKGAVIRTRCAQHQG